MDIKRILFVTILMVFVLLLNCDQSESINGRSSTNVQYTQYIPYRAKKYRRYYQNINSIHTHSRGYARYSRVYAGRGHKYDSYYTYMLSWLGSEDFQQYKNIPSNSISVCENYEANLNGTYLGVYTCPLPFEPSSHSYCCGVSAAEYCCKFQDVPTNVAAAAIILLMLAGLGGLTVYIIISLVTRGWSRLSLTPVIITRESPCEPSDMERRSLRKKFRTLKINNQFRWQDNLNILDKTRVNILA